MNRWNLNLKTQDHLYYLNYRDRKRGNKGKNDYVEHRGFLGQLSFIISYMIL